MMIDAQRRIDIFLQGTLNRALVENYDPRQDLLATMALNPDVSLNPGFLDAVIETRHVGYTGPLGQDVTAEEVIYADFQEAQLGSVGMSLNLDPHRRAFIDGVLAQRRQALITGVTNTAQKYEPKAFVDGRPTIEGARLIADLVAIHGHGYDGPNDNDGVQVRDSGGDFLLHPYGVAMAGRQAVLAVFPDVPEDVLALYELLFKGHDTYEDGMRPDSSQWEKRPNFWSPALFTELAKAEGVKQPKLAGDQLNLLTRTMDIDGAEMDYIKQYIKRIYEFTKAAKLASIGKQDYERWGAVITKKYDNGNNALDRPKERYAQSLTLLKKAAAYDPTLSAIINYESTITLEDIKKEMPYTHSDVVMLRDEVQNIAEEIMPEIAMPIAA